MTANSLDVQTLLGLLIVATLVALGVRWVRLPYEVALVLVGLGMAFTPGAPHAAITQHVILTVFLPVLLFHGAYNLSLAELRASLRLIGFLALPGVLATAGLVGLALHALAGLSWTTSLLFGTIIGATDPVSVLAVFSQLGAPRRLTTLVSGESLFNDGTALVLFVIVLDHANGGSVSVAGSLTRLVLVIGGSGLLGVLVGLVGAQTLRRVDDALVETSITLIIAYGGYLLADRLALSGPLETVVAGVMLSTRGEQVMSATTRLQAGATWEFLDFLANSLLFLLMGLAARGVAIAPSARIGPSLAGPLVVALVAVLAARVCVVYICGRGLALFRQPLPPGWEPMLIWVGLRGAVSLAAVLSLPANLRDHDLLLALTFGVVLFTLLAQGLTIAPLARRLGLTAEPAGVSAPARQANGSPPAGAAETVQRSLGDALAASPAGRGLDDGALAALLGISPSALTYIRRYPLPASGGATYQAALDTVAQTFEADASALHSLLDPGGDPDAVPDGEPQPPPRGGRG